MSLSCALQLALAPAALAAGPEAAEIKSKADASFDSRNYAQALEQYRAALAQGGDPRMHYNIAQTLTALERYPEALVSYQAFLTEAPAGTLSAAQQERFFALLDELKAKISRVEVKCDVAGARVLVRDRALGTTPLPGPISLNAGPAKIEVLAEGFKPFVTNIDLAGGVARTVDVALERVDFSGALSVKSSAAGARVLVDGAERGTTPLSLRVDRGAHVVVVRASGYVEQSKTVTIEAGGRTELQFSPARSPDYTLAFLGFGVGFVGVAAGSVTGILAFTSWSSAKAECYTPAKECGPAGQPELATSKTFGTLSTVAFGVGAAGIGVGAYGWVRARRGRGAAKPVEIMLLPGGLGLRGGF